VRHDTIQDAEAVLLRALSELAKIRKRDAVPPCIGKASQLLVEAIAVLSPEAKEG